MLTNNILQSVSYIFMHPLYCTNCTKSMHSFIVNDMKNAVPTITTVTNQDVLKISEQKGNSTGLVGVLALVSIQLLVQ